ncbi:MAG: hypothetical protein ACUVUR_08245, partial [bacterium]
YKLIYQGVFGPAHLVNEPRAAAIKIKEESARVRSLSVPEVIEPVDPEGLLIRVNLAPLTNSPRHQKLLVQALIETCRTFSPKPELLPLRIKEAINWSYHHLPAQTECLETLAASLPVQTHHSEIYIRNYHPAYRVILSCLYQF